MTLEDLIGGDKRARVEKEVEKEDSLAKDFRLR